MVVKGLKCIVCGKPAEYFFIDTIIISIIARFTYGGSYCEKHFKKEKTRFAKVLKLVEETSEKAEV